MGCVWDKPKGHQARKFILEEADKLFKTKEKVKLSQTAYHQMVSHQVYLRTSLRFHEEDIKQTLRSYRDDLRRKLKAAILDKKLDEMDTEEELWTWNRYGYYRQYRIKMADSEAKWRRQAAGIQLSSDENSDDESRSESSENSDYQQIFKDEPDEIPQDIQSHLDELIVQSDLRVISNVKRETPEQVEFSKPLFTHKKLDDSIAGSSPPRIKSPNTTNEKRNVAVQNDEKSNMDLISIQSPLANSECHSVDSSPNTLSVRNSDLTNKLAVENKEFPLAGELFFLEMQIRRINELAPDQIQLVRDLLLNMTSPFFDARKPQNTLEIVQRLLHKFKQQSPQ
ncbi:unnamed protein product [Caenorhabditis sp. 36 PRJEB53466]|nr:unnamed protein product [Caenorhabditis sp. 36 PRJEB53466]